MGPVVVIDQNQAQIVGTATGRVNAANRSSAAVHGVVRSVLFQSRSRDQSEAG